jgi:hypothetical protein
MDDIHVLAERPRVSEPDVLRHFRAFKTPAHDFDPCRASERELMIHGLPRRPSAETHPRLAAKWDRIVAQQRFRYIEPELRVMPTVRRGFDPELLDRRSLFERELDRYFAKLTLRDSIDRWEEIIKIIARLPETSSNWSGAYVKRPAAEQIVTVTGEWRVPGVNPPASAWNGTGYNDGTYLAVCWVGIDGTQGSGDVMQAGTGSQCVVSGGKMVSTSFFAWTEWFSLPWINVTNFPVEVGDLISCTVCAPFGNSHGTAMFNNLTQNTTTNVGIDPPSGTTLVGNVAEWIVEDPGQAGGGLFPFPNYGSTYFTDCTAGTKNFELDLGTAKEIDLVDVANNVLSSGSIENNRTLFCRYGSV